MNHFVIGESAAGSLKHAFRGKKHHLYALPLDLSVGPIAEIHKEEGIRRYFEWLNSSFTSEFAKLVHQEETYRQTLEKIKSLKTRNQATIWTSDNAAEQIGLRLFCFLTAHKQLELSVVNTAEAMNELMRESDIQIEIRHSGECNGRQLAHFLKHSRIPLPRASAASLAEEMKQMLSSESLLRSWEKCEILHADETRDDKFILNCVRELEEQIANNDFNKATRVVGEVFGHSYHIYSDAWIDYRLRSLIHSGKLLARGDLGAMRTYEVRTSGIEG